MAINGSILPSEAAAELTLLADFAAQWPHEASGTLSPPHRGIAYGLGALAALWEWRAGATWLAVGFGVLVVAGLAFETRRIRRTSPGRVGALGPATVRPGWDEEGRWDSWGAPFNAAREGHHQDEIVGILAEEVRRRFLVKPWILRLVREPENPYDRLAIRIECQNVFVAYLRRTLTPAVSQAREAAGIEDMYVAGVLVGGGHLVYGIHL